MGFFSMHFYLTYTNSKIVEKMSNGKGSAKGYQLSMRYQIEENLRSLKLLRYFVAWSVVVNIVLMGWVGWPLLAFNENELDSQVMMTCLELLNACAIFAFTPISLLTVAEWRYQFLMLLGKRQTTRPQDMTKMSTTTAEDPLCAAVAKLTFGTWYIWQTIFKAALSSGTVLFVAYMFARKLIWIHNEVHSLIGFKLLIVAIYALINAITHGCCMFSMSSTILLLLFERSLAIHPSITEKFCHRLTRLFVTFEICFYVYIAVGYNNAEYGHNLSILHCLQETMYTEPFINDLNLVVICIDVPTMFYGLLFKFFCEYRLKKRNRRSLQHTYRIRYSLLVVNSFLPVIFFHCLVIAFQNIIYFAWPWYAGAVTDYVEMKNIDGLTYITPYYIVVMPIMYRVALQRLRERREREFDEARSPRLDGKVAPHGEIYRNLLASAWAVPTSISIRK
ncbi:unnamed protein product, partial [Mesorhabditis spiculigera]